MTVFHLGEINDDAFVLHFGSNQSSIDAEVFGIILLEISETLKSINSDLNPGYLLEVKVEALGKGSFRASIRTLKREVGNLFSTQTAIAIIVGVFVNFLYDTLKPSETFNIIIKDDRIIIQNGDMNIIVDSNVINSTNIIKSNPEINRRLTKVFDALISDSSIQSFGISTKIDDPTLAIDIPRHYFPVVRDRLLNPQDGGRRQITTEAVLSVHKAIFARSKRKWEFVWNGIIISAQILDDRFFDQLERREISIKQGDAFRAQLLIEQEFEPITQVWMNKSYKINSVGPVINRNSAESDPNLRD